MKGEGKILDQTQERIPFSGAIRAPHHLVDGSLSDLSPRDLPTVDQETDPLQSQHPSRCFTPLIISV